MTVRARLMMILLALFCFIAIELFVIQRQRVSRYIDSLAMERASSIVQLQQNDWYNHWMGVTLLQYPNDLILYQELIYSVRPDVVIETGTWQGGLTLYLASLLSFIKPEAQIITVDLSDEGWNKTTSSFKDEGKFLSKIRFIKGDSIAKDTIAEVKKLIPPDATVLVILDSLHTKAHVINELNEYGAMVTPGSYIVVTDTHLDGTQWVDYGPGPAAAASEFLANNPKFEIDSSFNRFSLGTATRNGFLRRLP